MSQIYANKGYFKTFFSIIMLKKNKMDEDKQEVGSRIREIRRHLGLNQTDFGEKIGLKQNQVAKIESGMQGIDRKVIISLNRIFNIPFDYILLGEGKLMENQKIRDESKDIEDYKKEIEYLKRQNDRLLGLLERAGDKDKEIEEYKKDILFLYKELKRNGIVIESRRGQGIA